MNRSGICLLLVMGLLCLAGPALSQNRMSERERREQYDRWLHADNCGCDLCSSRGGANPRNLRNPRNPRNIQWRARYVERPLNSLYGGLQVSYLTREQEKLYPDNLTKYFIGYQREARFLPLVHYSAGLELLVNGGRDNQRQELNLLYLSVPLSLRLNIGPAYARGGFSGAIRLSAQEYLDGEQIPIPRGKYRVFDSGVFLGGGVRFLVFFAEIRHTWGQMDVIDGYSTRQWQLGGGITF